MQITSLAISAAILATAMHGASAATKEAAATCTASKSCHVLYNVYDTDQYVRDQISWPSAQAYAATLPAPAECGLATCPPEDRRQYLVSINTLGEQQCLIDLMNGIPALGGTLPVCSVSNDTSDQPRCPRPWTGGRQSPVDPLTGEILDAGLLEPAGGFSWDSGEDFYNDDCDAIACNREGFLNAMIVDRSVWSGNNPDDYVGDQDQEHYIELSPIARDGTGAADWGWNDRAAIDPNDNILNAHFIVEYKCVKTTVNDDPHFTTWSGQQYDYHGQCDLEVMSDPNFDNGKGLMIHARTEIVRTWSYIKAAAIKLGDDILEVEGSLDVNEQRHWINGVFNGELTTIGGYRVAYKTNGRRRRYIIYMDDGVKIVLGAYKDWVRVDFHKAKPELFGSTVGLFGDYQHGRKLGRDGKTVFHDVNKFGQEWQVQADAPMLFHEVVGPQAPFDKCIVPENPHAEDGGMETAQLRGRRLAETAVSFNQAAIACSQYGIRPEDFENCVSDVLSMDDLDYAEAHIMDDDWGEESLVGAN